MAIARVSACFGIGPRCHDWRGRGDGTLQPGEVVQA